MTKGEHVSDGVLLDGVLRTLRDPVAVTNSVLRPRRLFTAANRRIIGDVVTSEAGSAQNFLELGSGTGELARLLPDGFMTSRNYVQTEPNEVLAREARRLDPAANVVVANALNLDVPDGSQDVVLGLDLLDMIEDTPALVQQVGRVLAPGGKFIHFHDIRPNLDWTRNKLPGNAHYFPGVDDVGSFNHYQAIKKKTYREKGAAVPPRDKAVLDRYLHLVYHHEGLEHLSSKDKTFVRDVSNVVRRSRPLQPRGTKPLRQIFVDTATAGFRQGGLHVVTAENVTAEAVVPLSTMDTAGIVTIYPDTVGLRKNENGTNFYIPYTDAQVEPGLFLQRGMINVFVAQKPAA